MERSIISADYKPHSNAYCLPLTAASRTFSSDWQWRLRSLVLVSGFALLGILLTQTHPSTRQIMVAEASVAEVAEVFANEEPAAISAHGEAFATAKIDASPLLAPIPQAPEKPSTWREITVRSGDTISSIFRKLDLDGELHSIFEAKA